MQYDTGRGIFRPSDQGGGIFSNTISGLGSMHAMGATPWRSFSPDTTALQVEINESRAKAGLSPIKVDGILGPETCGAAAQAGVKVPSECSQTGGGVTTSSSSMPSAYKPARSNFFTSTPFIATTAFVVVLAGGIFFLRRRRG